MNVIINIMQYIIAAGITGFCMIIALLVQHVLLSRKKKIEDVTGVMIPRRAELYREFLKDICSTGVHFMNETGQGSPAEKVVFLHETCCRAIYELSPFASENILNVIMKLSGICADYREKIITASPEEVYKEWNFFKQEFQFYFLDMLPLIRSDCMANAIDRFVLDSETKRFFNDRMGYPWLEKRKKIKK